MSEPTCTLAVPDKCDAKAVIIYLAFRDGQIVQASARCRPHKDAIAMSLVTRMYPSVQWFTASPIRPVES